MKWRKVLFGLLAYLLSAIIVSLLIGWCWLWLVEYEEYKVVEILASREIDLGVPVYAQFSLSQVFEVQSGVEVTKVVLPLYIPDNAKSILITLMNEDNSIATWNLNSETRKVVEMGVYNIELMLAEPSVLGGTYRLVISGYDISHIDKERAPRVFVEKDDSKYDAGNYWIAGNKKEGDISLKVIGRRMKWQDLQHEWGIDPLQGVVTVGSWLLLVLVAGIGPHVLLRWLGGGND